MRRWGQIPEQKPDSWYLDMAKRVYQPDIYKKAALSLIDDGLASEDDFDFETDGFKPPQSEFIDGKTFDGRKPNAYIDQFEIGLKADSTVKE